VRGHTLTVLAREQEKPADTVRSLRRLLGYATEYRRGLLIAFVFVIVAASMTAAGPYLIGRAIDSAITQGDPRELSNIMLLLLASYLTLYAANYAQFRLVGGVAQQILARVRAQIFEAVQRLDKEFFDRHEAGDLMSRLVNDVQALDRLFSQGLVQSLGSLFGLLGIVIAMLLLEWRLALASFVVIPAMFLATGLFGRLARRAFRRTRRAIGDVSANIQEDISSVRVAQAFNRTRLNAEVFRAKNAENRDANIGAVGVTSAFLPVVDIIGTAGLAIVAVYGGWLALRQPPLVTVGVVVAFLAYVQQFFRPIQMLSSFYAQAQSALAASERVFELLDQEPKVVDAPDAADLEEMAPGGLVRGEVVFEDVSFSYQPGVEVLQGVNFTAEPGRTVAIVGLTGAGKTTIANLLLRFYDVTSGRVSVDGVDVRRVRQASLRAHMGLVLQEPFLFTGTIADNIRYGDLSATDEDVRRVAEMVGAHAFITALPDGYDHMLGERGGGLSQGQRQLLSIARALVRDPRILVLDEATSSVDTRTEAQIQQALQVLFTERTTVVIAHRLSTIRRADRILVMSGGRIVEEGTHEELSARGEVYAGLYARQSLVEATAEEAG